MFGRRRIAELEARVAALEALHPSPSLQAKVFALVDRQLVGREEALDALEGGYGEQLLVSANRGGLSA